MASHVVNRAAMADRLARAFEDHLDSIGCPTGPTRTQLAADAPVDLWRELAESMDERCPSEQTITLARWRVRTDRPAEIVQPADPFDRLPQPMRSVS